MAEKLLFGTDVQQGVEWAKAGQAGQHQDDADDYANSGQSGAHWNVSGNQHQRAADNYPNEPINIAHILFRKHKTPLLDFAELL